MAFTHIHLIKDLASISIRQITGVYELPTPTRTTKDFMTVKYQHIRHVQFVHDSMSKVSRFLNHILCGMLSFCFFFLELWLWFGYCLVYLVIVLTLESVEIQSLEMYANCSLCTCVYAFRRMLNGLGCEMSSTKKGTPIEPYTYPNDSITLASRKRKCTNVWTFGMCLSYIQDIIIINLLHWTVKHINKNSKRTHRYGG